MRNEHIMKFLGILFLLTMHSYGCTNLENSSSRRYIFIDGGAHVGESVLDFEQSKLYPQHPWEIFSFEANPELIPYLTENLRLIPRAPKVTVINKAMWIDDKGIDFFFGVTDLAGNVVKTRDSDTTRKPVHVDSVDFGQWLKKNFKQKDFILVKMDIEGAEYPILKKMLKDGSMKYVDKLYVEFHPSIAEDESESKDKEIVEAIKKLGIPVAMKSMSSVQGSYFSE